ncbi:MAG: LytTR family DNA-binding domain-containing protein [Cyclobacteriaceae bacterium]
MNQSISIDKKFFLLKTGKIPLYAILVVLIFFSAVLQDFIYSKIKHTGFYLSESMLYNIFWAFFIPLSFFSNRLIKVINPHNKPVKLPLNLIAGIAISLLHILLFAILFIAVSNLVYTTPHRFSRMFNTAFANQYYLALLWYTLFPALYISARTPSLRRRTHQTSGYSDTIRLKIGTKIISVQTSTIQLISTDKPYSVIYIEDRKILDTKRLKEYETQLDPARFLRVHRSSIINASYIKDLNSRSNGDYDATLENGQIIRLSRHYRNNWHQLLQ